MAHTKHITCLSMKVMLTHLKRNKLNQFNNITEQAQTMSNDY